VNTLSVVLRFVDRFQSSASVFQSSTSVSVARSCPLTEAGLPKEGLHHLSTSKDSSLFLICVETNSTSEAMLDVRVKNVIMVS